MNFCTSKISYILVLIAFVNLAQCSRFFINNIPREELMAVAVIYRHGDRSPLDSFPNDKYFNESYWPMGFGQLTKNGIERQYQLGKWFRRRYQTFLSDLYVPKEIYVYSTDVDRCLMSAYAALAGMYPPEGFQMWNSQLLWQPIPVHTEKRSKDEIIVEPKRCKRFKKEHDEIKKVKNKVITKEHKELMKHIANCTGWKNLNLENLKSLRSILYAYSNYNETLIPECAKNLDQGLLDYFASVVYTLSTDNKQLAKLFIGPFFDYLIKYFDSFIRPSSATNHKFLMVSAHDTSMVGILNAMGAFQMRPVHFSDTLIWELKRTRDGNHFVNLMYKRGDNLEKLNIYNCDFNCDYNRFKYEMEDITISIEDWLEQCEF